ncbi:MAG: hypothetical protein V1696_03185 [Candidatus Jorgensenbacteria bacterium]
MTDNRTTVISQSTEEEIDRSVGKVLTLALVGAVLSVITAYAVQLFLTTAETRYLVGGLVAGFFFFIELILESFFVKNRALLKVIAVFQGVVPLVLFSGHLYPVPSIPLIAGVVLMAAFLAGGAGHGAHVLKNSMKVQFVTVTRAFLSKLLTGVLIFVSVLFYLNYFAWGGFNEALGRKLTDQLLKASEPVVGIIWGGVRFDQTVGEVLAQVAEKQLRSAPVEGADSIDFSQLPPELQQQAVQGAAETLRGLLVERLGPFTSDEKVTDVVYGVAARYVANVSPEIKALAGALFALALFFSLKGFFSLFLWFVAFVAYLFFKLLVAVNFAHVSTETTMREFVIL